MNHFLLSPREYLNFFFNKNTELENMNQTYILHECLEKIFLVCKSIEKIKNNKNFISIFSTAASYFMEIMICYFNDYIKRKKKFFELTSKLVKNVKIKWYILECMIYSLNIANEHFNLTDEINKYNLIIIFLDIMFGIQIEIKFDDHFANFYFKIIKDNYYKKGKFFLNKEKPGLKIIYEIISDTFNDMIIEVPVRLYFKHENPVNMLFPFEEIFPGIFINEIIKSNKNNGNINLLSVENNITYKVKEKILDFYKTPFFCFCDMKDIVSFVFCKINDQIIKNGSFSNIEIPNFFDQLNFCKMNY